MAFATHRATGALMAYRDQSAIDLRETRYHAIRAIAHDYLADDDVGGDDIRVAMAHRRAYVRAINEAIRAELQSRGALARVEKPGADDGPTAR